jgi:hypothetical protein
LTNGSRPYDQFELPIKAVTVCYITYRTYLFQAVLEGHTLVNDIPSDCPPKLKTILEECWQKDTYKRPEMKDILARLKDNSTADSHYSPVFVKP